MGKKYQSGSEEMKKMRERVLARIEASMERGINKDLHTTQFSKVEYLDRSQLLELVASMARKIANLEKALSETVAPTTCIESANHLPHQGDEGGMNGRLAFNYAYISQYPDRAERWMKEVMRRGVASIPREFRPVMARALDGERTGWLPALTETVGQPDCDTIILWAQSIPGGDMPDLNDDEAGIVTYMDNEDEHARNVEVLQSLPSESQWVAMCKEFTARPLRDCH